MLLWCGSAPAQVNDTFTIKGDISRIVELWGVNPDSLVLTFTPASGTPDTIPMLDCRFVYTGKVEGPYVLSGYLLAVTEADPDNSLQIPLFIESGDIKVWSRDLPEEGMIDIIVDGTPNNELRSRRRSDYYDRMFELGQVGRDTTLAYEEKQIRIDALMEKMDSLMRFMYRDNRDSPIAPLLAAEEFYMSNRFIEAGEEYARLSAKFPDHPDLHGLNSIWLSMDGIQVGDTIPEVCALNSQRKTVSLQELNKDSYLLLDFWSSLSGPNLANFRWLKKLPGLYEGKPLVLVGISTDLHREVWQRTTKRYKPSGIQLWDEGHRASKAFHITSYPVRFLIDPHGVVVAKGNFTEIPDIQNQEQILF